MRQDAGLNRCCHRPVSQRFHDVEQRGEAAVVVEAALDVRPQTPERRGAVPLARCPIRLEIVDGIARTVRRARASIYRRWPSKPHLVAYCIVSTLGASPAPDTGVLRKDLLAAVGTRRRAFAGPLGQALPGLVADMANDPELARAVQRQVLAPRRKSMRDALDRARARGEAREALDIALVLDLLAGPFYFRKLFGHRRIDRRMTREVVDYALKIRAPQMTRDSAFALLRASSLSRGTFGHQRLTPRANTRSPCNRETERERRYRSKGFP